MAKKKNITDNTSLSRNFYVADWKDLRNRLLDSLSCNNEWNTDWGKCITFLDDRLNDRYFNPIDFIIRTKEIPSGKGFAVSSILCILLEFFASIYEGKVYTTKENIAPYEYNKSGQLFKSFLTSQAPFSIEFTNPLASGFYASVRCGLLHELRTKSNWIIRESSAGNIIECNDKNIILYYTNFYNSIKIWYDTYKIRLKSSQDLKTNLIRKIDDLIDIKAEALLLKGSLNNVETLSPVPSVEYKLDELQCLLQRGLITQEEYDTKRKRLMDGL